MKDIPPNKKDTLEKAKQNLTPTGSESIDICKVIKVKEYKDISKEKSLCTKWWSLFQKSSGPWAHFPMDNMYLIIQEREKHHLGQMRDWIIKEVCTTHPPPANLTEAHTSVQDQRGNTVNHLSVPCYHISFQGLLFFFEESCKADDLNFFVLHIIFYFWAVYFSHLHTPWGPTDCLNSNIWSGTHSWNFLAVWFKRRLLFPLLFSQENQFTWRAS